MALSGYLIVSNDYIYQWDNIEGQDFRICGSGFMLYLGSGKREIRATRMQAGTKAAG